MTNRIVLVEIASIEVNKRLRGVGAAAVTALAESMRLLGQLQPILVCYSDSMIVLVAGLHRLEAAKRLGWKEIEAVIVTDRDIDREFQEIAENLHRAELSALERDEQIAKWVDLVGRKPVQTEQVSVGGRGNKGGEAQTSRELGLSRPDVHRALKVSSLSPEAKQAARDAGLDDNRSALIEASKAPAKDQASKISEIAESKKKPKSRKPRGSSVIYQPEDRDVADLHRIQAAWEAASDSVRAEFLKAEQPIKKVSPARGAAAICERVREAIIILSGLPPAHEVVGYFAGTDGSIIISERLRPAAAWLAEFSDAWKDEQ